MFIFISIVCFLCGLVLPFQNQQWEPFVIGPVLICSIICLSLLTVQVFYVVRRESPVMLGQLFILWSILHMLAALSAFMWTHFLWIFSSVCWQISYQIANAQ